MIVCKRLLSAFLATEHAKNLGKTGSLVDLSMDCRVSSNPEGRSAHYI